MDIQLDRVGLIVSGDECGSYVKIVDDSANTGGYLIFTSSQPDMKTGFDDWVQSYDALLQYVAEAKWKIAWQ
jgi:hypothetical protein